MTELQEMIREFLMQLTSVGVKGVFVHRADGKVVTRTTMPSGKAVLALATALAGLAEDLTDEEIAAFDSQLERESLRTWRALAKAFGRRG